MKQLNAKGRLIEEVIAKTEEIKDELNLTQTQLAERIDTQQTSISRFLQGRVNPTLNWVENLFNQLGYDVEINVKKREDI